MVHVPRRVHGVHVLVGAPAHQHGPLAHVADLLEQLLRGPQESGPAEHRRVAREGPVRARDGPGAAELPPLRGRRRVRGRRRQREREVLARDLGPAAGQRVRVRQRRAVRRVGRRRRGRIAVERRCRRRPRAGRGRRVGRVRREPQLLAPAVLRHVVELPRRLPEHQVLVLVLAAAPVSAARRGGHAVRAAHERRVRTYGRDVHALELVRAERKRETGKRARAEGRLRALRARAGS
uniref:Uncharacterized protein n=1 Tax=Arundo donax TaxID=35708 RepID=A0A0A8ZRP1_ARUDO